MTHAHLAHPARHALPPGRAGGVARWYWLAALLPLLTACAGTLLPKPAPAPTRFTLDAGPVAAPAASARTAAADAPTLTVDTPRAAPGYDSRRMVYQRRPQQMEAFAFHEWVEPPAQMLAPLLVRALQDHGGFRAVLRAPSAAAGGWRLETELLRLHQDFSQRPSQVRLSGRAVLLNSATRQAVAWREFDVSVAATGDDPVAGAAAAQAAARQLSTEVAAFSAERAR
jgi:cholesterol transport system auxiliary component